MLLVLAEHCGCVRETRRALEVLFSEHFDGSVHASRVARDEISRDRLFHSFQPSIDTCALDSLVNLVITVCLLLHAKSDAHIEPITRLDPNV